MLIDILILIVVLVSVIIAFMRGFIREILTILGVGGGVLAAYFFGPVLAPMMRGWLDVNAENPEKLFGVVPFTILSDVLSYAGVFIVVVVVLSLLSHVLAETAKSIGLGAVDRTLGVVFGLVRAVLIVSLLYLPFYSTLDKETKENFFKGSETYFYLEMTTEWLAGFLPASDDGDDSGMNRAEKTFDNVTKGAREQLENMNILNAESAGETVQRLQNNTEGYTEEFRDEMNRLFEQAEPPQSEDLNE